VKPFHWGLGSPSRAGRPTAAAVRIPLTRADRIVKDHNGYGERCSKPLRSLYGYCLRPRSGQNLWAAAFLPARDQPYVGKSVPEDRTSRRGVDLRSYSSGQSSRGAAFIPGCAPWAAASPRASTLDARGVVGIGLLTIAGYALVFLGVV